MVQTSAKPITLNDFLAMPETKPASEFIEGQIFQKPMPQGQHSILQGRLVAAINRAVESNKTALALPELRCTFGGRSTVPDIAVFTWDRIPTESDGTISNTFLSHPDWAIEILSPNQSATRVIRNLLHCLEHGAQMGWLLDPGEQLVLAYPPNQSPVYFEVADVPLLVPAFAADLQLTLGELFGWLKVK